MRKLVLIAVVLLLAIAFVSPAVAAPKYKIAWSHYTGWEPWEYANSEGILKKWADKYGIEIQLQVSDYIESINLYTSGAYQGCVMTNMDALTIPAAGGVDSTALIVGDFSNGNDGIVTTEATTVRGIKGKVVRMVELSVSDYLMSRALDMNGMTSRDITLENASDADIATVFTSNPEGVVVTWNPLLMEIRNVPGANLIFDSSDIPGEIIDMMVVRTDAPDSLKKALTGAWFETMKVMSSRGGQSKAAIEYMAKTAGSTVPEFKAQLKTTAMFYSPADAVAFTKSPELKKTMDYVRSFSYNKGLFGNVSTKDFVGIEFADKTVMGDKDNVKLRFNPAYMEMAAKGTL